MKKIIYKAPLNAVSFGNVSYNLLREMYKRKISVSFFPIGNIDINSFDKIDPDFKVWMESCVNNRFTSIHKDTPTLQLWHINGSENRITSRQTLFSFYEVDNPTVAEKNLVDLQDNVIFSSSFAAEKFELIGCENTCAIPLGFDEDFGPTNKEYLKDKIHFGLFGKFEHRKHTAKILSLWAKKYGDNYDYQLTCCITNPFFKPEQMNQLIGQALEGKRYGNINFLPFLRTNSEVNDALNSIDIDLTGLSGGEGWNLPSFNATALGKWSIVLNASSHQDWATSDNSLLIDPKGKVSAIDGQFFIQGHPFNQGNIYTFDDDLVVSKMEEASSLAKKPNKEGKKLASQFTYKKTLDSILKKMSS